MKVRRCKSREERVQRDSERRCVRRWDRREKKEEKREGGELVHYRLDQSTFELIKRGSYKSLTEFVPVRDSTR